MELAVVCCSRLRFSVELTAREGQCLSLTWSQPLDRELFASRLVRSCTRMPLIQMALRQYIQCTYVYNAIPFPFNSCFIERHSPFPTAWKRYPFLFIQNGMKRKRHRFYGAYCTCIIITPCACTRAKAISLSVCRHQENRQISRCRHLSNY